MALSVFTSAPYPSAFNKICFLDWSNTVDFYNPEMFMWSLHFSSYTVYNMFIMKYGKHISHRWFNLQWNPAFCWILMCYFNRCASESGVKMTSSKQLQTTSTHLLQFSAACHLQVLMKLKMTVYWKYAVAFRGCGPHRSLRGSGDLAHFNPPQHGLLGWDQGPAGSWWGKKQLCTDR